MTDVQLQVDSSMTLRVKENMRKEEEEEAMNMEGGCNEFDFIAFNNDY